MPMDILRRIELYAAVMLLLGLTGCKEIQSNGDPAMRDASNLRQATNGTVELKVDANTGRIIHYGWVGGRNMLWTNPRPYEPAFRPGGWLNFGGDKIWPWPQQIWRWPPPEPKTWDVQVEPDGRRVIMTSSPIERFAIRIVREIELAPKGSQVSMTSRFEPTGVQFGEPLAVWSVTQVPHTDHLLVHVLERGGRQRLLSNPTSGFFPKDLGDGWVDLRPSSRGGKIFMDGDLLAAVYDDVVLVQRQIPIHQEGVWEDDVRTQVYAHPLNETNYPPEAGRWDELEWTAPRVPTQRIGQAPLKVQWELVRRPFHDESNADAEIRLLFQRLQGDGSF